MAGKARPNIGPNVRYVRSSEGADFYGLPIGSVIVPDVVAKINREAASLGINPPEAALEDANGQVVKTPAVIRPQIKVAPSKATGPSTFKIGGTSFGGPKGSRLVAPKNQPGVRYLIEPDGTIRAFNKDGEAEVPENLASVLEGRLSDTSRYEEVPFDSEGEEEPNAEKSKSEPGTAKLEQSADTITGKAKTGKVVGVEKITDRNDPDRVAFRVEFEDNRSFITGRDSAAESFVTEDLVGKTVTFDIDDMAWLADIKVVDEEPGESSADSEAANIAALEEAHKKASAEFEPWRTVQFEKDWVNKRSTELGRNAATIQQARDEFKVELEKQREVQKAAQTAYVDALVAARRRAEGAEDPAPAEESTEDPAPEEEPAAPGQSIKSVAQFDALPDGTRITINGAEWTRDGDQWVMGDQGDSIAHQYLSRLIGKDGQDIQLREEKNWRDLRTGDAATTDFVTQSPAGAKFAFVVETWNGIIASSRVTEWTKQEDGSWESMAGNTLSAEDAAKAIDSETTLVVSTGVSNSGDNSLYPGGASFPDEEVQKAYDGLLAHSGFQVFYGLPKDSPLRDRELVGGLTTAARAEFPELSPKQAVLAYLRGKLGIEDPAGDGGNDVSPKITIGVSGEGRKRVGVQGMNGGEFSADDVAEAIQILESFQGKAYKSELNKQGNPIGTLDPTSLVGIEKDKTVGKQKFIDYLKNALSEQRPESGDEEPPAEEEAETYEFPDPKSVPAINGREGLPGQQPTGGWMRFAKPGSAMDLASRGGGEGGRVYVKYRDGRWRAEDGRLLPVWVENVDEWSFQDSILRNGDGTPDAAVRTPEQLVGQTPETLAELDGLPVGTTFTLMGAPWSKLADGTYSPIHSTSPADGIPGRKLSHALRGIVITSVTTLPEEPITSFGDFSTLRVGETIVLRKQAAYADPSDPTTWDGVEFGVIATWTRLPNDAEGTRLWARTDGSITYDDNMPEELLAAVEAFKNPETLSWSARRDSAAPDDVAPEPAPAPETTETPTPEPAPVPAPEDPRGPSRGYTVGSEVQGSLVLADLPEGTRLIYTRKKDGRETAYNKRGDMLVTDRGTEVSFDRAARMPFRIESIPGVEAAPKPAPAPASEDERGESINGSYVGDRVHARGDFDLAPIGSSFWIGTEDNSYTKMEDDLWLRDSDGFAVSIANAAANYREATWSIIPTPEESAQTPWVSPPFDPDWVYPNLAVGDTIPRQNFRHFLNASETGLVLTATLENGVVVEYTRLESGKWDLQNPKTGREASEVRVDSIETAVNFGRAIVTVTALPPGSVPPSDSEGAFTEMDALSSPTGTVIRIANLDGREFVLARRAEAGDWETDSLNTPSILTSSLGSYIRAGRITRADVDEQPVIDFRVNAEDVPNLQPGAIILVRRTWRFGKNEDGTWTDYRGSNKTEAEVLQTMGSTSSPGSAAVLLTNGVSRNAGVELSEGMTLSPFQDLEQLPVGSRVVGFDSKGYVLRASGEWLQDGGYNPTSSENLAASSPAGYTLDRLGWSPLEGNDIPKPGDSITFEQFMRMPRGSRVKVEGPESFRHTAPNGEYVVTGNNQAVRDQTGTENEWTFKELNAFEGSANYTIDPAGTGRTYVYQGADDAIASSKAEVGGRVTNSDQLEALPVGATLVGVGNQSAVKIDEFTFAMAHDSFAHRKHVTVHTAEDLLANFNSVPVFQAESATQGVAIDSASPLITSAPEGSILFSASNLDKSWTRTSKGWTLQGSLAAPITPEALREQLGDGEKLQYIAAPKVSKIGKYWTVPEVAAARVGTLAYVRVPGSGSSKLRTGRYRFDGETWSSIDGKGVSFSREFGIAAAARGNVKIESLPVEIDLESQTVRQALDAATTFAEATEVARVAAPNVTWKDLAVPASLNGTSGEQLLGQYRSFLASTVRNLQAYPLLNGLAYVRGNREMKNSAFAYVSHPRRMDGNTPEQVLSGTSMTFNMRYGTTEYNQKNEYAATTNHFHGVAKPGVDYGDRTVTHEMGHAIDAAAQMKLGAEAMRLRNEYVRAHRGEFTEAVITESMSNYTRVGAGKQAELWAETFENWTNNTEVEPITEYMVQGVLLKFREITGLTDFEFVKNPGSADAEPNYNPLLPRSLSMKQPDVGTILTSTQLSKLPAGSVVESAGEQWEKEDNFDLSPWNNLGTGENKGYYVFNGAMAGSTVSTDKKLVSVGSGMRGEFTSLGQPKDYFEFEKAPAGTSIIVGVGDAEKITKREDGMWETPTGATVTNSAAYFGTKSQIKAGRPVRYGHSNKAVIWFSETDADTLRAYGAQKALEEASEGSKLSVPASATLPAEDRFIKVGGSWQSMLFAADTYTNARLAAVINSQAGNRLKLFNREVSNADGTPYKTAADIQRELEEKAVAEARAAEE